MGITKFDIELIEKALEVNPDIKSVCELGSQNLYLTNEEKPPFADTWYMAKGLKYKCLDMAGDNNALQLDLSKPIPEDYFKVGALRNDLVTDFGTSEHVVQMEDYESVPFHEGHINSIYPKGKVLIREGFYNCWLNKHNLLQVGGIMISVNPKTGHWPGHGYTYYTHEFYTELCKIADYEIIDLGENCAMGNCKTGINVYSILKKTGEVFPTFEQFITLDVRPS